MCPLRNTAMLTPTTPPPSQGSISLSPGPQGLTLLLERSISICYLYPEGASLSLCLGRGAEMHKQQQRLQSPNETRGSSAAQLWVVVGGGGSTLGWSLICLWPYCVALGGSCPLWAPNSPTV